jgi:hypothetical protein
MDAYCLIGCYRELQRRVGGQEMEGPSGKAFVGIDLTSFLARVDFPHVKLNETQPGCEGCSHGRHSPEAMAARWQSTMGVPVEVVDSWSAASNMVARLHEQPYLAIAIKSMGAWRRSNKK